MEAITVRAKSACAPTGSAAAVPPFNCARAVRALLDLPEAQLDYARAKLTLDALVDPATDADAVLAELDDVAEIARRLAGPTALAHRKVAAIRKLIHESGPWNDHRPFAYDHDRYRDLGVKLLSNYLAMRLGNREA